MARPQEHYCAVTASTMPVDRPPLHVEARNRLKRNTGPFGEPLLHTAFANPGSAKSARHCCLSVPSDSLLTNDKASLSLVTNEETRGTVTLLQSTEQAIELAEIAADARDYLAASRAENTTRVYRTGWAQFTTWATSTGWWPCPQDPRPWPATWPI
jgi:hypothetical protein